jgi:hypothetical protein
MEINSRQRLSFLRFKRRQPISGGGERVRGKGERKRLLTTSIDGAAVSLQIGCHAYRRTRHRGVKYGLPSWAAN